jgi:coenzyme F420-reducing hydrogenase beta subunit
MFLLQKKKACCGCEACIQICPTHCMIMVEDREGFLYPEINKKICTDCGLCEKVCPIINQEQKRKPLYVYAAKNQNEEIRLQSSSGGIFTLLAEKIINEGGVVFGARFDENWEVVHSYSESIEGMARFRGSKYVQSKIKNTFIEAKEFLTSGRKVLFSGTPCQIAGLKLFLKKEYKGLNTIDIVCHGVPSPKVFRMYLSEINSNLQDGQKNGLHCKYMNKERNVTNIQFRNKSLGWKEFSFTISTEDLSEANGNSSSLFSESIHKNLYFRGFLSNLFLRPSCHECPSKYFKSGSDITIADYWGIQNILPEFDDDKGVSLIMINSSKGESFYQSLSIESIETSYEDAFRNNSCIEKSVPMPSKRNFFFKNFTRQSISKTIIESTKVSNSRRVKIFIFAVLHTILLKSRLLPIAKSILNK